MQRASLSQIILTLISLCICKDVLSQNDVIIVKGNKEQKTLNQSQESIAIIQKDSLKAPVATDNLEAIAQSANVSVNKEDDTFTIRGVKNTGVTGYQKDNLASILVDRVFQTDLAIKASSFNLFDMDSLEIFRGSQSTGQGINALAGSVNLFHTDPLLDYSGKSRLEIGSHNKKILQFIQNVPIIKDRLATKISGTAQVYDGAITNTFSNNKKWAKRDQFNLNMDFIYYPNDTDQIKMSNKAFQSIHGGNYVHGPNPKNYSVSENLETTIRTKNAQTVIEYDKHLNEKWNQTTTLSYSNSKQISVSDSDLTNQNRTGERVDKHRDNFTSAENLLNFNSISIKNTLGIHWHRYSLIDNYDFNILPITNNNVNLNIKQYVDRKRKTYSIFDSFLFDLTETHTLNLGARYEYVVNQYLTNVSGSRIGTSGSNATNTYLDNYVRDRSGAYGGKNSGGKVLPKLAYLFHFSRQAHEEKSIGLSYNQGYRTGGVSINRYRTTAVNYDPETTQNFEFSFKGQFDNTKLNSNLFYTKWTRQQVQISLSSDSYDTQVENASRSEFFGLETEVETKLNDQHQVNWNIGFVKSQFIDFKKSNKNYNGNEFPNAPRMTSNLIYGFAFLDNYLLKTSIKYLGQSFADAENTKRINEQYYIDVGLQKTYRNFIFEINLKNILDKHYQINRFTNSYGTYYQMSTPREISGAVTYSW